MTKPAIAMTAPEPTVAMNRRRLIAAGGAFALASLLLPRLARADDIPAPEDWVGRSFHSAAGPINAVVVTAWHFANPVAAEGQLIRLPETWTTVPEGLEVSIVDVAEVPYIHEYTGNLLSWIEVGGVAAVETTCAGGVFLHVTAPGVVWAARTSGNATITEQADWIVALAARYLDRELEAPPTAGDRAGGLWDLLPTADDLDGTFFLDAEVHNGVATNDAGTPIPGLTP